MTRIDFAAINQAALGVLPALLRRWLPGGRMWGHEYVARNPTRPDRHPGSFKINVHSGRWSDFATGDKGGDPVSLAAYLFNLGQAEAAIRLAGMLGVKMTDARNIDDDFPEIPAFLDRRPRPDAASAALAKADLHDALAPLPATEAEEVGQRGGPTRMLTIPNWVRRTRKMAPRAAAAESDIDLKIRLHFWASITGPVDVRAG